MRSESVRWKEGTRCQFSGLCPRVQCRAQSHVQCRTQFRARCRTSHSLSHEPNSSPVTCQLANINMGASQSFQGSAHPNILWHQPWPPYHSSRGTCKLQNIKMGIYDLNWKFSQCFTAVAQQPTQPSPYTPPLSCHFGWRSESSNVARAERLNWCAAAHICGTRSRPPLFTRRNMFGGRRAHE